MKYKNPFKSKTVWIAILQAVAAVLLVVEANDPTLQSVGGWLLAKSGLDILLRIATNKPIVEDTK